MPGSGDQTRVGRTLTLGGGAESSLEGRDRKTSVLRPMISARTARIDYRLARNERDSSVFERQVMCTSADYDIYAASAASAK